MTTYLKAGRVRSYIRGHERNGKRKQASREFIAALDRLVEKQIDRAIRNSNGMARVKACDLKQGELL